MRSTSVGAGRRDEVYVTAAELLEPIRTLPPQLRTVFSALVLDDHPRSPRAPAPSMASYEELHDADVVEEEVDKNATTLTMVMLMWPRAYLVHVGDSRALYLSNGVLRPLTRDQTMGEFLIDAGAMTEEDVKRGSLGGTLYSALGGTDMTPSVGLIDFIAGDVLLLCSDGLTKHVDDARVSAVLGKNVSAEAMCTELLDAALTGGGSDNVTVIVARMGA